MWGVWGCGGGAQGGVQVAGGAGCVGWGQGWPSSQPAVPWSPVSSGGQAGRRAGRQAGRQAGRAGMKPAGCDAGQQTLGVLRGSAGDPTSVPRHACPTLRAQNSQLYWLSPSIVSGISMLFRESTGAGSGGGGCAVCGSGGAALVAACAREVPRQAWQEMGCRLAAWPPATLPQPTQACPPKSTQPPHPHPTPPPHTHAMHTAPAPGPSPCRLLNPLTGTSTS